MEDFSFSVIQLIIEASFVVLLFFVSLLDITVSLINLCCITNKQPSYESSYLTVVRWGQNMASLYRYCCKYTSTAYKKFIYI